MHTSRLTPPLKPNTDFKELKYDVSGLALALQNPIRAPYNEWECNGLGIVGLQRGLHWQPPGGQEENMILVGAHDSY